MGELEQENSRPGAESDGTEKCVEVNDMFDDVARDDEIDLTVRRRDRVGALLGQDGLVDGKSSLFGQSAAGGWARCQ